MLERRGREMAALSCWAWAVPVMRVEVQASELARQRLRLERRAVRLRVRLVRLVPLLWRLQLLRTGRSLPPIPP